MVVTHWAENRHRSAEALGKFIPVPFKPLHSAPEFSEAGARLLRVSARYLGVRESRPVREESRTSPSAGTHSN